MHVDERGSSGSGQRDDCPDSPEQEQALDARIEQTLRGAPPPDFATPEPPREQMTAGAYERAREPGVVAPYSGSRFHRRSWALAIIAAVAVVAAGFAIALWPLQLREGGEGVALDTAIAWAKTDGYIIDFDLLQQIFEPGEVVPEGVDVHLLSESEIIEQGLDRCSQILYARVLEDWVKAHAAPDGSPLLVTNLFSGLYSRFVDDEFLAANVSFTLLSDDQELLDDLLSTLARLPGVSPPRVYEETIYFTEKYPDIYSADRRVIINGKALRFPSEIPDAYVRAIHTMFTALDPEYVHYRAYWGYLSPRDTEPLVTGDVIEIRFHNDGDMVIDTVAEDWDCGWYEVSFRLRVHKDDMNEDTDPLSLLQQKADLMNDQSQFLPENFDDTPNSILKFNFFSTERLRNVFASKLTEAELQQSRAAYERMLSAYDTWLDAHPQLKATALGQGKSHIKYPATFGDGVLQVHVQLKTADRQLLDELTELLIEASGGIVPQIASTDPVIPQPAEEGGHITRVW